MSQTPWNSIAESMVDLEEIRLTHKEALESPCASCPTSPCCTHLPLHTFKITNMFELDHAAYLLNFDHIELGLSASGEWSVYYCYPCRFLDRQDFSCTVHNIPTQPQICAHYNPYNCWYKRVFTRSISDEFLRIDRSRLEFVASQIAFDEFRNIADVPDWATLREGIAALPLAPKPQPSAPPAGDPVVETWQKMVINLEEPETQNGNVCSYEALANPCEGCEAYCCKTLVFPQSAPGHLTNLDFFRFCLGFPGIELGISDDSWSLVVKTTCRHLEENRCNIYGQPERPLICKYYDAWKCTYKINFGLPRPPDFLRVRLEQFEWLADCFKFDQNGTIIQFPDTETIRDKIEQEWRQTATQPVTEPVLEESTP